MEDFNAEQHLEKVSFVKSLMTVLDQLNNNEISYHNLKHFYEDTEKCKLWEETKLEYVVQELRNAIGTLLSVSDNEEFPVDSYDAFSMLSSKV